MTFCLLRARWSRVSPGLSESQERKRTQVLRDVLSSVSGAVGAPSFQDEDEAGLDA